MAHFAKLDDNNVVLEVNVVNNQVLLDEQGIEQEQKGIEFLIQWSGGHTNWKQTSWNKSFRKNFASSGGIYDPIKDAFIAPKPYPSWLLNEQTCEWEAPKPKPSSGQLAFWDEQAGEWIVI